MYQNYDDFIKSLFLLQDLNYQKQESKLTFTKYEMIGVRIPLLRKIAKEISKSNYLKFLGEVKERYYEEVLIEGLVIATLKEEELLEFLPKYISKIDNWAICDSFCNSLKFIKKDYSKYFEYFKDFLFSDEEFKVRVGLVVFLNFYVTDEYIQEIFSLVDKITLDKYYVNMAIAWLLAECFIKYPSVTKEYLKNAKINDFTFNKAISKIRDSYRVSENEKDELRMMRR